MLKENTRKNNHSFRGTLKRYPQLIICLFQMRAKVFEVGVPKRRGCLTGKPKASHKPVVGHCRFHIWCLSLCSGLNGGLCAASILVFIKVFYTCTISNGCFEALIQATSCRLPDVDYMYPHVHEHGTSRGCLLKDVILSGTLTRVPCYWTEG